MDLSIIIPFRDGHATLPALLNSLPAEREAIIVDDGSTMAPDLARWPNVRYLRLKRRGYFAGAVNAGAEAISGDFLILNQDMILSGSRWLAWLADARAAGYAVAGTGQLKHPAWPAGYIQGQFMYVSREAWRKVGALNARDYPLWGGTADWQCRAARKGYKALPVAEIAGVEHQRQRGEAFGASITAALEAEPDKRDLLIRTPPLISIIITSYKYGRYLADCIASLIGGSTSLGEHPGQTLQAFEAIIVDDGSTDETAEVGKALADPWKAIRYIRREHNGGTPAANNTGIRASFGRYLSMLAADDMREPDSLEALYRVVERDPRAVAYDDICEFANGQRTTRRQLGQYGFDSLVRKNMMHAGILYSRRAYDEAGGYHESMREGREDWQFNIALGLKGYCGQRVAQYGYLYRREGQNRSLGNQGPEWHSAFVGQLRQIWPDLYRGVKPMGCCGGASPSNGGGGARAFGDSSAQPQQDPGIGSEGMTLLEYLGGNTGTESWYGAQPRNTRYVFGGKRRRGWVDNRDVAHFLSLRENRRPVFQLAESSPEQAEQFAQPIIPAASSSAPTGTLRLAIDDRTAPTEAEAISEPAAPPPGFSYPLEIDGGWIEADPRELTVAQVTALAPKVTADQRARMLAMENESSRPRKGALSALEPQ